MGDGEAIGSSGRIELDPNIKPIASIDTVFFFTRAVDETLMSRNSVYTGGIDGNPNVKGYVSMWRIVDRPCRETCGETGCGQSGVRQKRIRVHHQC